MKINESGRVTIPAEIRKQLDLESDDTCSMNIIDGNIVITKFEKNKSSEIGTIKRLIGGRIIIPKAYRKLLGIKGETEMTMGLKDDVFTLKIK